MKKTLLLYMLFIASIPVLFAQPAGGEFDFTPGPVSGGVTAIIQVNDMPATGDDWIAVFDEGGNCAGATALTPYGGDTYTVGLFVYGNDDTTPDIDEGMELDGSESFTFRLWVAASDEILENPMPEGIEPVSEWTSSLMGGAVPGWGFADGKVLRFMGDPGGGGEDADGDGFAGADDPDDTDPCNPDNNVTVCDSDGDGIADGSDPYPDCAGEPDECGVCNGSGIADGTCDCDGTPASTWYADTDGDGLGDPGSSTESCDQPDGFVSNSDDPDDNNGCTGVVDECGVCDGPGIADGTCDCDGNLPATWYADTDGDGLGDPNSSIESCDAPGGYVSNSDDNDDNDSCPGTLDECGVCDGPGPATWYADTDGDGLGDPGNTTDSCDQPSGFVSNGSDMDDTVDNSADVPTLSQWGLILLSLILLSITTVSIIQNKYSLANKGGTVGSSSLIPYFDAALFRRMLLKSVPLMLIIFVAISFIEDGWFVRNLIGIILSAGVLVYLLHFITLSEWFKNGQEK